MNYELRGRLEKTADLLQSKFVPDFVEFADSQIAKEGFKISNERDFVIGGFLTLLLFEAAKSRPAGLTQDESIEVLEVAVKRFREIDRIIAKPKPKPKSSRKNRVGARS
ncbi:hypothetical protein [Candidatus Nitrososphaera evergladensis]|nr:hypothetical protein [Candidatus Nitrososphaera evergladensis]